MSQQTENKKKRGRKKKSETIITENIQIEINANEIPNEQIPPVVKKRGRKPKGGKIITKEKNNIDTSTTIPNVILHLKCFLNEINNTNNIENEANFIYNPSVPPEIESFNQNEKSNFFSYDTNSDIHYAYSNNDNDNKIKSISTESISEEDQTNMKDINSKLKSLKINLYKNTLGDKKSACFWCTYEFDNPPCYIPKYEMDEQIYGYGSFCRPECAVAYLMKEHIDDSSKFDRYNILNNIYGKVYNYEKNIKPAPDPHFLLDKFYGNLTIQEYRRLLNSEHLLLLVERPMTRILPELYEDNDNFIMNIYGNSNNNNNSNSMFKVKRNSEKKDIPSKKTIIQDTFGLSK
tara:strand:+ start:8271 stop:9314 length:1044 start_codon:yes stop_codon:yes gene_type:complete